MTYDHGAIVEYARVSAISQHHILVNRFWRAFDLPTPTGPTSEIFNQNIIDVIYGGWYIVAVVSYTKTRTTTEQWRRYTRVSSACGVIIITRGFSSRIYIDFLFNSLLWKWVIATVFGNLLLITAGRWEKYLGNWKSFSTSPPCSLATRRKSRVRTRKII